MDFDNPEEFDELVERSKRIEGIIHSVSDEEVEACTDQLADWLLASAEAFLATGLGAQETVTALVGTVSGLLAEWYAVTKYNVDEDDDES